MTGIHVVSQPPLNKTSFVHCTTLKCFGRKKLHGNIKPTVLCKQDSLSTVSSFLKQISACLLQVQHVYY